MKSIKAIPVGIVNLLLEIMNGSNIKNACKTTGIDKGKLYYLIKTDLVFEEFYNNLIKMFKYQRIADDTDFESPDKFKNMEAVARIEEELVYPSNFWDSFKE